MPFSAGKFLNKRFRLTTSEDISRVRKSGKSFVHATVVLGILPNNMDINRIAVIAGRSVGKAVQRNFAKRRLRSAYESFHTELNLGYDLVFIARQPLLNIEYGNFIIALGNMFRRAKILKESSS